MARRDIVVLDCETLHSAEDCRHCFMPLQEHTKRWVCPLIPNELHSNPNAFPRAYEPIGWRDYEALGVSVCCVWDQTLKTHYFYEHDSLPKLMKRCLNDQSMIVSFNGKGFDAPLLWTAAYGSGIVGEVSDPWHVLWNNSYDILAEIWQVDPDGKYERGLNSLDALLLANGLPPKTGHGADAPRWWQAGEYDRVRQYCRDDVDLTWQLCQGIAERQGLVKRAGGRDVWIRYLMEDGEIREPLPTEEFYV